MIQSCQDAELGCKHTTMWTHVGIAIPNDALSFGQDEASEENQGRLFILESVISGNLNDGVPAYVQGRAVNGVQVRDLESVVAAAIASGHQVGVVHLKYPDTIVFRHMVQEFWDDYQYAWFDFIRCFRAVMCFPFVRFIITRSLCCAIPDDAFMFCSDLATRFYQRLGFIPGFIDPKTCSPQELVELTGDLANVVEVDYFQVTVHVFIGGEGP